MTDMSHNVLDVTFREKTAFPRFGKFAWNLMARLREKSALRRDLRQLLMMPDYILKDMGISRADILPADAELRDRLIRQVDRLVLRSRQPA